MIRRVLNINGEFDIKYGKGARLSLVEFRAYSSVGYPPQAFARWRARQNPRKARFRRGA
jgi:hypothetical protein